MAILSQSIYTGAIVREQEVRVEKIRVLLANYPRMLPDNLRTLVMEQDDMEMVGDCRGAMKILQEIGRTKADVVILVYEGTQEPALCSQLLAVYPDLTILGVDATGRAGFVQQLRPHRQALSGWTTDELLQQLRTSVADHCHDGRG